MSPRDYTSIKDYADAQKEIGSCAEEFKDTMKSSFKAGLVVGIPFGLYSSYRMGHRSPVLLTTRSLPVALTTFVAFSCLGLMTATYNCLRVKM